MVSAKKFWKRFVADEQGLETIEYAVMTALIVAAMVVAITALEVVQISHQVAVRAVIPAVVKIRLRLRPMISMMTYRFDLAR